MKKHFVFVLIILLFACDERLLAVGDSDICYKVEIENPPPLSKEMKEEPLDKRMWAVYSLADGIEVYPKTALDIKHDDGRRVWLLSFEPGILRGKSIAVRFCMRNVHHFLSEPESQDILQVKDTIFEIPITLQAGIVCKVQMPDKNYIIDIPANEYRSLNNTWCILKSADGATSTRWSDSLDKPSNVLLCGLPPYTVYWMKASRDAHGSHELGDIVKTIEIKNLDPKMMRSIYERRMNMQK